MWEGYGVGGGGTAPSHVQPPPRSFSASAVPLLPAGPPPCCSLRCLLPPGRHSACGWDPLFPPTPLSPHLPCPPTSPPARCYSRLQVNTTLEALELNGNVVDYEGVAALAEALAANTSLKTLGLSDNYLGPLGAGVRVGWLGGRKGGGRAVVVRVWVGCGGGSRRGRRGRLPAREQRVLGGRAEVGAGGVGAESEVVRLRRWLPTPARDSGTTARDPGRRDELAGCVLLQGWVGWGLGRGPAGGAAGTSAVAACRRRVKLFS